MPTYKELKQGMQHACAVTIVGKLGKDDAEMCHHFADNPKPQPRVFYGEDAWLPGKEEGKYELRPGAKALVLCAACVRKYTSAAAKAAKAGQ
jgi:hypothetical protein